MRRVWLALLIASLGGGTAGVATRVVLDEGVGPYTVAALRSALAAVVVVVFLVARRSGLPRSPEAWKVGLAMGISKLALPHPAPPEERLSTMKGAGLILGFAGVAALLGSGDSGLAGGGKPVVAGFLSLVAVASIAVGGVYAKHHAGAYQPLAGGR